MSASNSKSVFIMAHQIPALKGGWNSLPPELKITIFTELAIERKLKASSRLICRHHDQLLQPLVFKRIFLHVQTFKDLRARAPTLVYVLTHYAHTLITSKKAIDCSEVLFGFLRGQVMQQVRTVV